MIGFAVILMWLGHGRITGISGIVGGLVKPEKGQVSWRVIFVLSLVTLAARSIPSSGARESGGYDWTHPWPVYVVAGLLVGVGTRTGSGCTSGHGICGLARLLNIVRMVATADLHSHRGA